MKVDLDYLSKILNVFLESDKAHIDILTINKSGISIIESESRKLDEKFIFHMQNALENGLISDKDLRINGLATIGISLGINSHGTFSNVPIRLTQKSHDFASAIHNKEILLKLKSELKDAPFRVIFDGSQKLIQHYLKKKLGSLIE